MRRRGFGQAVQVIVGIALLTAAAGASSLTAQVPAGVTVSDTTWRIELTDGSTLIGQVVATTPERITIRTATGVTVELQRGQIRSMSVARGTVRDGVLWGDDPNRTRLFFAPTGRMLPRGEGYVGVFQFLFPFAATAVTDNVTLAGGTPIFPEAIGRVWYFAPKVGTALGPRSSVAGGVIAFADLSATLSDDLESFGLLYLVGTHGTDDNALTAAVGWGFSGADLQNRPAFMAGGETRIGPRLKLLSENYLITYRDAGGDKTEIATLVSGGLRFFGERLSADAGLVAGGAESEFLCCLPMVNFVYNFGGGR
jgi:hypothetical protein